MTRSWKRFLLLVLLLLPCSSCGGKGVKLYPVRGRVLYAGSPAEGAMVVFHPLGSTDPQALRPAATVAADGSFQLGTYAPGDGAPAGQYVVTVDWLTAGPGAGGEDHDANYQGVDRLRGRYSSPEVSRLRARVKEGSNELEAFQLP